ncbi:MAG TPA: hypothetical protein ENI95_15185 [Chloroflexi bacterium]|nr:hypothetical protein [Chloroflexota bacterium]
MAQATVATRPSFSVRLLIGGLVASMVMGMWEMILEAVIPGGSGFWSPVIYIAATVLRGLQSAGSPVSFHLPGVVLGLMGHMMNSAILGLIFALLIAPRLRSPGGQIIGGMVFGVMIFAVMWFGVLPLIDPVMLNLNFVVFLLGHAMWGVALGLVNYLVAGSA